MLTEVLSIVRFMKEQHVANSQPTINIDAEFLKMFPIHNLQQFNQVEEHIMLNYLNFKQKLVNIFLFCKIYLFRIFNKTFFLLIGSLY